MNGAIQYPVATISNTKYTHLFLIKAFQVEPVSLAGVRIYMPEYGKEREHTFQPIENPRAVHRKTVLARGSCKVKKCLADQRSVNSKRKENNVLSFEAMSEKKEHDYGIIGVCYSLWTGLLQYRICSEALLELVPWGEVD